MGDTVFVEHLRLDMEAWLVDVAVFMSTMELGSPEITDYTGRYQDDRECFGTFMETYRKFARAMNVFVNTGDQQPEADDEVEDLDADDEAEASGDEAEASG